MAKKKRQGISRKGGGGGEFGGLRHAPQGKLLTGGRNKCSITGRKQGRGGSGNHKVT